MLQVGTAYFPYHQGAFATRRTGALSPPSTSPAAEQTGISVSPGLVTKTGLCPRVLTVLATILCAVALAFPLLGYGYSGVFTRYVADDFCSARNLALRGYWGSQIWTYRTHSGRFFSYFARISVQFVGGQRIIPFLGASFLISWLAATTWTFNEFANTLGWRQRLLNSLVLAELIVFAMLRTGPDPGQSFFWEDGAFTYTAPIILLTLYVGVCLVYLQKCSKSEPAASTLWLAGILAFFAAGNSETNAALQCVAILLGIVICSALGLHRSRYLNVLWAGLLGSLLSSILVVIAPGNAVREGYERSLAPALPRVTVLVESVRGSLYFVRDFLRERPLAVIAMLALPTALALFQKSEPASKLRWTRVAQIGLTGCAVSLVLVFSTIVPGMFALSRMPPDRALFAAHWILLASLLCAGIGIGTMASRCYSGTQNTLPLLLGGLALVTLTLPWTLRSTRDILFAVADLRRYALEWDNQDRLLRKAKALGNLDLTLPWNGTIANGGNVDGAPWLSSDPSFYVNKCTADYYALHTLRTVSPPVSESNKSMAGDDR